MANVSIRVDDVVKQRAESICSDLGMSLSTATNLFYKKLISYGGIPFELRVDPFYSEENQAHLEKVINNYNHGKSNPVYKKIEELEEMEGWYNEPYISSRGMGRLFILARAR